MRIEPSTVCQTTSENVQMCETRSEDDEKKAHELDAISFGLSLRGSCRQIKRKTKSLLFNGPVSCPSLAPFYLAPDVQPPGPGLVALIHIVMTRAACRVFRREKHPGQVHFQPGSHENEATVASTLYDWMPDAASQAESGIRRIDGWALYDWEQ